MTEAEQITAASKSNLALAFVALSKERRQDISVFYAFCRIIDDIADEPGLRSDKATALNGWRAALLKPVAGESALAKPVRDLMAKYSLAVDYFQEIIAGVEMDLDGATYATWEDLRLYCHRVASVVGLVSISIFGAKSPETPEYARQLGLALQLTNILRDVGQDLANEGRIYLPKEDLERFGVTREDLTAGRRTPGFLALMDFEAERAEELFRSAVLPLSDKRELVAAEIMRAVYYRLLQKMRADRWRVFDRRYSLSKVMKLWLVATSLVKSRFSGP